MNWTHLRRLSKLRRQKPTVSSRPRTGQTHHVGQIAGSKEASPGTRISSLVIEPERTVADVSSDRA